MSLRIGPNREALRLYRGEQVDPSNGRRWYAGADLLFNARVGSEILRTSGRFYWPNDKGEPWRDVLRREARKEFEAARHEKVRPIRTDMVHF